MLNRKSPSSIALLFATLLTLLLALAADAATGKGRSHGKRHVAATASAEAGHGRVARKHRARGASARATATAKAKPTQRALARATRHGRSHRLRLNHSRRQVASGAHHRRIHRGRVIVGGNFNGAFNGKGALAVRSEAALVIDQNTGQPIYAKNDRDVLPIASITKLMTALVVLDAAQPMDEMVAVTDRDVDRLKLSTSRLRVGARLNREQMLRLALMASENRAASALAHAYPGGQPAFVAAMNRKAHALNMTDSHFADATGLNSNNVSTARDLVQLVQEGWRNPYIRAYTTTASYTVPLNRAQVTFNNTNPLVKQDNWHISLSKTGFIDEAGRCLVMRATLAQKDVVIVLLNSQGKYTRIGDANRVRQWMEAHHNDLPVAPAPLAVSALDSAAQSLTASRSDAAARGTASAQDGTRPVVLATGRVTEQGSISASAAGQRAAR